LKTKTAIAKLAGDLGVPFEDTWSCYKGGEHHCGRCSTCVERLEAIAFAGLTEQDRTPYIDYAYWKEVVNA
jgi:7-cyano-7-deazaguanine synthase